MTKLALKMDAVRHAYDGVSVLDGVDLTVGEGEMVCLLGSSGCGKTTLLRIAAGIEPLREGRISIQGQLVADGRLDVPPEARGIGMVFQDHALFPHLDVLGNVSFGLMGLEADERRIRALATLRQVGMEDFAARYPHNLSGGQQQRVALARAIAPNPRLLFLDEPFSGLDTRLRTQLRDDTLHILRDSGISTLMVTHDPAEAMYMADRLAVMRAGRIVQVGDPVSLYDAPVDEFVAGLFGYVNRFDTEVSDGVAPTPLGAVPAPGFANGAAVKVLVRPEGVRLFGEASAHTGAVGRILATRFLGRSHLVHLVIGEGDGGHHVHSQIRPNFDLVDGGYVHIVLEAHRAFVFAREAAN